MKADTDGFSPFATTPRARAAHQRAIDAMVERRGGRFAKTLREHMDREARLVARAVAKGEDWKRVLDADAWSVLLFREVWKPEFMAAARMTWDAALDRAQKDMEDDVFSEWLEIVLRTVRGAGAKRIADILGTTITIVQRILDAAIAEGLSSRALADQLLENVTQLNRSRAERIARTEVHSALNQGSIESTRSAARELGLTGKKIWVSTPDERTRWWHRDVASVGIDEKFAVANPQGGTDEMDVPGDMTAGAHQVANCFPADTLVWSPDVVGAMRSLYDGQLVTIQTADGHELTGTPNHPVLTDRGWVALGALNDGANLFVTRERPSGADLDVQNVPTRIEQVFDALSEKGVGMRLAGSLVNFYGDRPSGDVDVVHVDSQLWDGFDPVLREVCDQLGLECSDAAARALLGQGLLDAGLVVKLRRLGSNRFVGRERELLAGLCVSTAHSQVHRVASTSRDDASVKQRSAYAAASDAVLGRDRLLGHAFDVIGHGRRRQNRSADAGSTQPHLLDVAKNNQVSTSEVVGDVLHRAPFGVQTSQLVAIKRYRWQGHVYTLTSRSGLYDASGVVVRNCRCTVAYELEEPEWMR